MSEAVVHNTVGIVVCLGHWIIYSFFRFSFALFASMRCIPYSNNFFSSFYRNFNRSN